MNLKQGRTVTGTVVRIYGVSLNGDEVLLRYGIETDEGQNVCVDSVSLDPDSAKSFLAACEKAILNNEKG